MCEDCLALKRDGYIALVGADPDKGDNTPGGAHRTGEILHMKREAFDKIFNVPAPEGGLCFVEPAVVEQLKQMAASSEER